MCQQRRTVALGRLPRDAAAVVAVARGAGDQSTRLRARRGVGRRQREVEREGSRGRLRMMVGRRPPVSEEEKEGNKGAVSDTLLGLGR